ncbi:uncharacterized protein LOC112520188 [Cynara cardunculus var. scolymus]|uniref:uncharacterized protein LOC112520188 n=1 Tax=Cynara cardunculus var. scolymus TaxID=59895 RepID=UPI000D62A91F|nr:uncharacterized protein LOC112520188 [Cynara cardunculus var. scolymus]
MKSTAQAMPWVGLYVAVASLICTLAMAADVFQGFRQGKLWFPCKFFTLNAASITLIAIAMKLPVDLTTNMSDDDAFINENCKERSISVYFLLTMLANFLPSLGGMDDKELFTNIIALTILIITIIVNMSIQLAASHHNREVYVIQMSIMTFFLLWPFWVAFTVPASRRVIQHQYQELHRSVLDCQEIKFSSKELTHHVKKYWMIAETGNPQFVLASSPFCSASGLVCSIIAAQSILSLIGMLEYTPHFWDGKSDYKWSINVILTIQYVRMVVGSIAPTFRCITTTTYFNLSKEWSINHINMFRVEKHWTQRLRHWKRNHYTSHIPGRHCKKVFNHVKNMILNLCIALQMTLVVICKTICLVPTCIMLLFCSCCHFCNSLLKRFREEPNASNNNARSEIKEYIGYALQIEEEAKLSKRMLKNMLKSITKLLYQSEKKQPRNLVKFLEKPTGFNGVAEFDNDQVPPLHPEETNNCWSLIAITLTAVALALPNIENGQVKGLLASMSEGLQFVTHIEETLDANGDLVKARKTARRVWTEVEVYCSWLHIDLQMKAHKGKMSQEILQWLSDEAIQIVIQFKQKKKDLLCACFTNLPRVITLKCHHDAIEKREESIRTAAQLLGKSKTILNILEGRQLPDLDQESMAYIDKWQALPKSQVPNGRASSAGIQSASSSSNKSVTIAIT